MAKKNKLRLSAVKQKTKFRDDKDLYDAALKEVQEKLMLLQSAYFHEKRKAIVVFEGWDAAGKGGVIRRFTERLDPRGFQVHPVAAPTVEERARHYLYRFWLNIPPEGTTAIFDRSWYGRVLVERVEELIKKSDWKRAYREINEFEQTLSDDGIRIVKVFIHITKDEQLGRFKARLQDPVKRWKLTEDDLRNRERWSDYEDAIEDMFDETSTKENPWLVVGGNSKEDARIEILNHIFDVLSKGVDWQASPLDKKEVAKALKSLR